MNVIYPRTRTVFLAGTIDDGNSTNWQEELINMCQCKDIVFFNPRRKEWLGDLSKEELEYQIKWEQEHLDSADIIIMCLLDNSKSPISLLELGLYAQSGKLMVFCNKAFYKYDNVRLTCQKYNIPLYPYDLSLIKDIL